MQSSYKLFFIQYDLPESVTCVFNTNWTVLNLLRVISRWFPFLCVFLPERDSGTAICVEPKRARLITVYMHDSWKCNFERDRFEPC